MKKIALTSLIAMFAFSGAHAANVIDGNPLYLPKAGHAYSVTSIASHSEATKNWALGEEFGYGITNKLVLNVNANLAEAAEDFVGGDDEIFDSYGLTDMGVKATFRALDMGAWKTDVYGAYTAGAVIPGRGGLIVHSDAADDTFWFDKDLTGYTWTAGVRGGYTTSAFTLAGHVEFSYFNIESFNWGDYGNHVWKLGLDGQFVIDSNWNLVAGVEYTGVSNDKVATYTDVKGLTDVKNAGMWTGEFGVNYNIDATKFVGLYVNGALNHHEGDKADEWGWNDGYGFGAKFGIDF